MASFCLFDYQKMVKNWRGIVGVNVVLWVIVILTFRIRSSQSHRRPLPLTPPQQRSRFQRSSVHHCPGLRDQEDTQRDTPLGHGELRRRETVHWFPLLKESESEQEHIYEEIHEETSDESDEELTKEEVSPHSFLSLISLERRRHLRFYGRTDWDYGGERF